MTEFRQCNRIYETISSKPTWASKNLSQAPVMHILGKQFDFDISGLLPAEGH